MKYLPALLAAGITFALEALDLFVTVLLVVVFLRIIHALFGLEILP